MKIVYICNEYPPKISGGIGVFTKLMAERLAAEGHEIIVFGYGENALETVELESTVKVIRLVEPRFGKNLFLNFFKTLFYKISYRIIFSCSYYIIIRRFLLDHFPHA